MSEFREHRHEISREPVMFEPFHVAPPLSQPCRSDQRRYEYKLHRASRWQAGHPLACYVHRLVGCMHIGWEQSNQEQGQTDAGQACRARHE